MSLGIVCDGTAEALALQELVGRLRSRGQPILRPIYADMQPLAPLAQIVGAAKPKLSLLSQRGANRFVVVLDRENQRGCPGELAANLRSYFARENFDVSVVLKDRAFENWLISDPGSLQRKVKKVNFSDRIVQRIERSGADSLSAITLLNECVGGGYSKRRDAIAFCGLIDPQVASRNSRSFRKFIKECEC